MMISYGYKPYLAALVDALSKEMDYSQFVKIFGYSSRTRAATRQCNAWGGAS